MQATKHTFLFQEGWWIAKGQYADESGQYTPVEGHNVITHQKSVWINEGFMRLSEGDKAEFRNSYEIIPFKKEETSTNWKSRNPILGTLFGRFTIVADTIISTYKSESNEYSGVEILMQVNETTYKSRGFAVKGDRMLSAWTVTLEKRVKP